MKIIIIQQKAQGLISIICKVILRHSRFTGCLARDQNLPTVSDKIYRLIHSRTKTLSKEDFNSVWTLYGLHFSTYNISHIKLPKISCVMVAVYIVRSMICLLVGMAENQLLLLLYLSTF